MEVRNESLWVCEDCYFAHHYGKYEHEGLWYAGENDMPCEREPLSSFTTDEETLLADNTCPDHDAGEGRDCPLCGSESCEDGIWEFSWNRCHGCNSSLGGSRYRLSLFEATYNEDNRYIPEFGAQS